MSGDVIRLADFIAANREPILVEWEAFARTCAPASGAMDIRSLRDHANEMLTVIAADLQTHQTNAEQAEKSKGEAAPSPTDATTAAEHHGAGRAESGFTVEQMVAEFRALRASVVRLWTAANGAITASEVEDLTRFNESIDQALAESVARFTQDLESSKEMFLAILGHDLRSPLNAIMMSAEFMLETHELVEPHLTLTSRISSSSKRMEHLIDDLLDFTRSRLGGGIPVVLGEMSMDKVVHDVVAEVRAAHRDRTFHIDARSAKRGEWDCNRVSQALTNLVINAVQHGSAGTEINVGASGDESGIHVAVQNRGPAIPAAKLNGIFNPMKVRESSPKPQKGGASSNLGLGLYIAERIVTAHMGRLEVESSEAAGTTFTMHLPWHPAVIAN